MPGSHPVWDLPTRLFHWSLVYFVLLSWLSHEDGLMNVHQWSGYAVLVLVIFRAWPAGDSSVFAW